MTDDTYTDTLGRTYAKRQPSEASRAFTYSRKRRGQAPTVAPVEHRPYDADPTPQPMIAESTLKERLMARRQAERTAKEAGE